MAGTIEKIAIISNFFKSFNKNPEKEGYLVNFFLEELQNYTDDDVRRGVNMLITGGRHNYLPKSWELVQHIEANIEKRDPRPVPCFICASFGYVFGVIGIGDGERIRPMRINIGPVGGYKFQSVIMGRCNCINGQRLSSEMDQVEPLPDIVELAKSEDKTCVYIADRWADRLNGKSDPNPSQKLIAQVENIMKNNKGVKQYERSNTQDSLFG